MLTKEDLEVLREAFTPTEIRARVIAESVDSQGQRWVTLQAYLPLPVIEERLEKVDPSWSVEFVVIEQTSAQIRGKSKSGSETKGFYTVAKLIVKGIVREGIGFDEDPRAAASMAFKNAASRFGVGRYLEKPEWQVRRKIPDDRIYRRIVHDKKLTWDDVLNLLDGGSRPSASAPKAQPQASQPNLPGDEEVPF